METPFTVYSHKRTKGKILKDFYFYVHMVYLVFDGFQTLPIKFQFIHKSIFRLTVCTVANKDKSKAVPYNT